jgi:hypothetical protein
MSSMREDIKAAADAFLRTGGTLSQRRAAATTLEESQTGEPGTVADEVLPRTALLKAAAFVMEAAARAACGTSADKWLAVGLLGQAEDALLGAQAGLVGETRDVRLALMDELLPHRHVPAIVALGCALGVRGAAA